MALNVNQLAFLPAFSVAEAGAVLVGRAVGAGQDELVRYAAVVGATCAWALTPPLAWLLGLRLGLGAMGGWLGLCAEVVLSSTLLVLRVERGGWRAAARLSRAQLRTTEGGRAETGEPAVAASA